MTSERSSFTLRELELARHILEIGAPVPPKCICGGNDNRFSIWCGKGGSGSMVYLRAQCRVCGYSRYWNGHYGWGPRVEWENKSKGNY